MRKIIAIIHYVIYLAGIFILLVMGSSKYDWMQEMDNTMTNLPKDSSGNVGLVMAILGLILVIMQAFRFKLTHSHFERKMIVVLTLLGSIIWLIICS
ncbi:MULTISPECIES: hypothetical protein [unclassified Gilliamella]|uniref:hypothetical protein n=1 Tax=unclassified Gilliamella TaxID=2685620 RepID=UPI00080E6C09|nr:hypothetical protein [Gilliamella apicola]OCG58908.1 hypothetical protein A9G30_12135 [Gilliamella apicola]OCG69557.1 hypothetical protein A9G41_06180 [Gilliamella apicola]OCG78078.1 hypothetical protein A9G42_04320 [Gilliamella apicola]